jgi:hypothetical protein
MSATVFPMVSPHFAVILSSRPEAGVLDAEFWVSRREAVGLQVALAEIRGHHLNVVLFQEGRPTEPRYVRYGLSHGVPAFCGDSKFRRH